MKTRTKLLLALLLGGLGIDQLVQYTVLRDGVFFGQWVIPFDPPLFTHWQKSRLQDLRAILDGNEELARFSIYDPELGWCPAPEQTVGAYRYDWSGSRTGATPLARTKSPEQRRIVAVGGSFTQGAEVVVGDSWPHLLGQAAGLEVANLGVAGYGVDQACLRLERDGVRLDPDEVWLGFMPEGSLRILTHFPPVYRHWSSIVAFKPRFRMDGDALVLEANPAGTIDRALELLADQEVFLDALSETDHWVRRSPAAFAPRGTSWTHWFATSRLLFTYTEGGERFGAPYFARSDSEVRLLLKAIVDRIRSAAEASGARFRLLVLPSRPDLRDLQRTGEAYWAPFVEEVRDAGVDVIDVSNALLEAGAAEGERFWMPNSHYSPEANRLVAETIERGLRP